MVDRFMLTYALLGWQTQRDPVNRSTRSSTTAQPVAAKRQSSFDFVRAVQPLHAAGVSATVKYVQLLNM